MKGVTVVRGKPSNSIDIYALLKEASKEGSLRDGPTEKELQDYYFGGLISELCHPNHFWLLARRGRGFIGFVHAFCVPGRWGHRLDFMAVDLVYVAKNRRKLGIGRKLLDELKKEAENIGIRRFEFLANEDQANHWGKEIGAKPVACLMRV